MSKNQNDVLARYPLSAARAWQTAAAPAIPKPADPALFTVLDRHFLIRDRPDSNPSIPPLFGTLSWCPGRQELIARSVHRGQFNDEIYSYFAVDPEGDAPPRELDTSGDHLGSLAARKASYNSNPRVKLHRLEPTAQEKEFDRFCREWPFVSEALKLVAAKPAPLFEPGQAFHPSVYDARLGTPNWRELLTRHTAGGWGTHGSHDPAPLDDEALFLIGLQSQATRNSYAAAQKRGVVRSTYPVAGQDGYAAHVCTALLGNATFTLMIGAHPAAMI
jgi:hypothetical protein